MVTTIVIPNRKKIDQNAIRSKRLSFFLPAMTRVRISQINDEFKFSRESQSFPVVVTATPLLISHKKRSRIENRTFAQNGTLSSSS
jgi:hypothetical protein